MYDHIETLPSSTDSPDSKDINIVKNLFGNMIPSSDNGPVSFQILLICSFVFFLVSQPRIETLLKSNFNICNTSSNMCIIAKTLLFFSILYLLFSYLIK